LPFSYDVELGGRHSYEIPLHVWREALMIFALLGIAAYLASTAFLHNRKGDTTEVTYGERYHDKIDGTVYEENIQTKRVPVSEARKYTIKIIYGYSPKHASQKVSVKTGEVIVCEPCGEVLEDRTNTIIVPRINADRYKVRVTPTRNCDICKTKPVIPVYEDGTIREADATEERVAEGMAKPIVESLWGKPYRKEVILKPEGIVERMYYKDPVFGINVNARYADYDSRDKVVSYRDVVGK